MIEAHELTQRCGDTTAAEHIGAVAFRNGLLVLLLPGILSFIRLDWAETIVSRLPLPASSALLTTGAAEMQGAYLSAQASLIVMAAYAVVPLAAAAVVHSVRQQSAPVTTHR
jgi:uncharacterized membrane protein